MATETEITNYIEHVNSRDSFIHFVALLKDDFITNKNEWENQTIESYLEAMLGFTMDIDGYFKNNNIARELMINPWRLFAEILLAATIYE